MRLACVCSPAGGEHHWDLLPTWTREKSDLRCSFSMRSLTRENPLEVFSEYEGSHTVGLEWSRRTLRSTFANNPLVLVLRCDSKGKRRASRQVGEGGCEEEVW